MTGESTRVALTGFGSVGQAFAQIVSESPSLSISICAVADRGGFILDPSGLDPVALIHAKKSGSVASLSGGLSRKMTSDDLRESGAEVLLELASTNYSDGEPGWSYVRQALESGLDVVLASKGPLVAHWDELFALAQNHGRQIRYSATHGAPLPVVEFARSGLAGSRLRGIRALFNSTTGLLLEKMEQGRSLDEAVEIVASKGVAETNPRLDIEGWDAAAKCVIVARSLFDGKITIDDVDRTGIDSLETADVVDAAMSGKPIRLLATIQPGPNGPIAVVTPTPLEPTNPLAHLRGGSLGVIYDAPPLGSLFLASDAVGTGGGGPPTAAAVIRDIVGLRANRSGN